MLKYINLVFLCVSLSGVLCDLNEKEGAECEWEELKGKCVKETQCLTTVDDKSPKHPVCSEKGGETFICCTDCELVNNTGNFVISPTGGFFWKNGQKARDNCLQYLKDLPYQCKLDFYGGISRKLNDEKKCYNFNLWGIGGAPPVGREPRAEYPHQVLLGYGDDLKSAMWQAGGFIISDRFIVTAAHAPNENLKYLATGVQDRSASPESWQIRQIKRVIKHPEYKAPSKYYDIALIETDSPVKFDENVLPVCLHVDETANIEEAVATTWLSLDKDAGRDKNANTIQTIALEEFSEEECKAAYGAARRLKNGYDHVTQMCYGSKTDKTNPHETCKGLSGEPLLIRTQFSRCIHTAIGISSFGKNNCIPKNVNTKSPPPDVYTRVSHYVPWIESIVWP